MKHPMQVGLTGGIGSGKSTVKQCFDELGVPATDADEISRRITRPGQAAFDEVVALFGKECQDEAGNLNRRYLREVIFAAPAMKTGTGSHHPPARACRNSRLHKPGKISLLHYLHTPVAGNGRAGDYGPGTGCRHA